MSPNVRSQSARLRDVIPSWFVFVGAALSLAGAASYIRAILHHDSEVVPNRVTWILWGVAPVLAFVIEIQQHVGLASVMTLVLGVVPFAVLAASAKSHTGSWQIGPFDVACGVLSVIGIVVWLSSHQPTLGLIAQVAADSVAALPTVRKAWLHPASEAPLTFLSGSANATLTLLTLHEWTTAGALFPVAILCANTSIAAIVILRRPRMA